MLWDFGGLTIHAGWGRELWYVGNMPNFRKSTVIYDCALEIWRVSLKQMMRCQPYHWKSHQSESLNLHLNLDSKLRIDLNLLGVINIEYCESLMMDKLLFWTEIRMQSMCFPRIAQVTYPPVRKFQRSQTTFGTIPNNPTFHRDH